MDGPHRKAEGLRGWLYRGRHRATASSPSVYDVIRDAKRYSIAEMFAMQHALWAAR